MTETLQIVLHAGMKILPYGVWPIWFCF